MRHFSSENNGRRRKRFALTGLALLLAAAPPLAGTEHRRVDDIKDRTEAVKERLAAEYERLETLYQHLHANPELSLREARTSARLARELKEIGFDVKEQVGGYGE